MRLILTAAADADLSSIFRYSKLTFGKAVAANYAATLNAKINLIHENPQIGRCFDEIDDGMRRTACLRHHIYFRSNEDELRVIRILHHLHQQMDAQSHLDRSRSTP